VSDIKYTVTESDVLVIGAGLAGLRAAYEAARRGCSVTVVSKGPRCSAEISGFNAPLGSGDSATLFYEDIQRSGCSLNDPQLGKKLALDISEEVCLLESLGLEFQKDAEGRYDLLQPLGCRVPRLVHAGTDTGLLAERCLLRALADYPIVWQEPVTILALMTDGGTVCGAIGHKAKSKDLAVYSAKAVVMAAGGCSGMFSLSTYPAKICGDSSALAFGAGAKLIDMELIDVEPCCLLEPTALRGHGISSTMLFAGGVLRNARGENIVEKYFSGKEEIYKSRLARAMYQEIYAGNGSPHHGVFYDLTQVPEKTLQQHESSLPLLKKNGIELTRTVIEVAPAHHTALGGIMVNKYGASSVPGLFAGGEAMGGLHGANRIGGNAGAAVFVFGAAAGRSAAAYASGRQTGDIRVLADSTIQRLTENMTRCHLSDEPTDSCMKTVKKIISEGLPLICGGDEMQRMTAELARSCALARYAEVTAETVSAFVQMENVCQTASVIAAAAQTRKESRGVFNRSDFPQTNSCYDNKNTITEAKNDGIACALIRRNY